MGKCEKGMAFSKVILNTINLGGWLCDSSLEKNLTNAY